MSLDDRPPIPTLVALAVGFYLGMSVAMLLDTRLLMWLHRHPTPCEVRP